MAKVGKRSGPGRVLITGAASGIGAELCRLFARDGYELVLVDKNEAGLLVMRTEFESQVLSRVASGAKVGTVHCLRQDLSRQEAAAEIFDYVASLGLTIDVLVNNAGFGTFGPFWEIETSRDRDLVNVNVMTPMLLTKLFLPDMVARGHGKILNVGSVSGFSASPFATCYYSSKAFLLSFSTGLNSALKGTGVTATVACPGPTHTAFNWCEPLAQEKPARKKPLQMDAGVVAAIAYRGMQRGQAIVVPGWSNKALALLAKFMPRSWALALVKKGQTAVN